MAPRQELQDKLIEILGDEDRVYFQPRENVSMQYPAIVYSRDSADTKFADDGPYLYTQRYSLQYISRDVDDDLVEQIRQLETCVYDRFFTADDLNHDVFSLYY